MSTPHDLHTGFDLLAGLAAAALPGAGHALAGDPKRGLRIGAGVLGLFTAGLLIGGIDCVDRAEDGWWFIPQAMIGPAAFAVDHYHQNFLKKPRPTNPGFQPPPNSPRITPAPGPGQTYTKSLGKPNDIGILFTSIAGMLNLIVVIDAAFPTRRRPR
ncbi:MAG: hypothetical protein HRU70_08935 [Phycisphaeraceae bacterium]|nr:MAG: hypothetical protein HRU70_08935 [Phycisphaeraceae bacterium]